MMRILSAFGGMCRFPKKEITEIPVISESTYERKEHFSNNLKFLENTEKAEITGLSEEKEFLKTFF